MMQLAHFILIFAITVEVVAIYIAIQLYNQYKIKYLLSNIYMLAGFSILTISNTIETFLKIVYANKTDSLVLPIFINIILFILPLIVVFATFHAIKLLWGMINKRLHVFILWFFVSIAFCFILTQIVYFIYPIKFGWFQNIAIITSHLLLFISILFSLLGTFFAARKINNLRKKKALRNFIYIFFTFISLLLFLIISTIVGWITLSTQIIILSIVVLIFNLSWVLFFKLFFKNYHVDYMVKSPNVFDDLIKEFGITKRESEIILLLCDGKTNKEIAEELFIAPLTARDHISNIYRKVKVKNRVQLVNQFRT
ncbi:helix-turn-helix transcriptional regulator [Lentimicrobium sp. S6]|uniref:helix-turn-helix domain-containing protein n=1 Tax=Lentimicrobium sp. S6 TaxID=2735872 RepID=UPI0020A64430|nr:helix-turn-helix transcriptional regulator [Lentimicrobium sp. S6]